MADLDGNGSQESVIAPNFCYDLETGWISFATAWTAADDIEVTYVWSNKLDIIANNYNWIDAQNKPCFIIRIKAGYVYRSMASRDKKRRNICRG